jgi:sulfur carrier protein
VPEASRKEGVTRLTCLNLNKYAHFEPCVAHESDLTITLNGEPYELAEPLTLMALLERLRIDPRRVAVEHNRVVVRRARYDDTRIGDGDEVEIVNFVGGGCGDARPGRWS